MQIKEHRRAAWFAARLRMGSIVMQIVFEDIAIQHTVLLKILHGMSAVRVYLHGPAVFPASDADVNGMGGMVIAVFIGILRLEITGVQGVVVGKAIYEGRITLEELSDLQRELL